MMRHHFVLTLQWQTASGPTAETQHGTVVVSAGMSRNTALQSLIEKMRRGRGGDPVVLFFSLEPNDLQPLLSPGP